MLEKKKVWTGRERGRVEEIDLILVIFELEVSGIEVTPTVGCII